MAKDQVIRSPVDAAPDLGEELRYLKWDLAGFLNIPSNGLLSMESKDAIAQLIAWIAQYTSSMTPALEPGMDLLAAVADHLRRSVNDFSQPGTEGDRKDTPRERLLRGQLSKALARITQATSLLKKTRHAS